MIKKHITHILIFLIFTSCRQPNSEKNEQNISTKPGTVNTELKNGITLSNDQQKSAEHTIYESQDLSYEFKNATIFKLTDTIFADFNGDGKLDQAFFKKENETSGIVIIHGQTNEKIKIGFGEPFAHLTEFNWVDFWGLVNDSETYEIVIEDTEIIEDRIVKLENPSIVVRKKEVGGGLITFKNRKYQWIHQAD